MIVKTIDLIDIIDQRMAHIDATGLTAQQHMIDAARVAQLEEELGLAWVAVDDLIEVGHHLIVEQVGVHRDGNAVDSLLLHTLQILHVLHLEFHLVAVHEARLQFRRDIDGSTLCEHPVPTAPVLAEQGDLARALEVLDGDEATGLPFFENFADGCHNATQDNVLALLEVRDGSAKSAHFALQRLSRMILYSSSGWAER